MCVCCCKTTKLNCECTLQIAFHPHQKKKISNKTVYTENASIWFHCDHEPQKNQQKYYQTFSKCMRTHAHAHTPHTHRYLPQNEHICVIDGQS